MERLTLQVGSFEVNCSILSDNGKAWVVDPGQDADRILDLLGKKGLEPAGILLTHAHFDHIGAIPQLQKAFPELPVYVHPNDVPVIAHFMNAFPPDYPAIPMPKNVRPAKNAEASVPVEVIETPGHTPGGVCYFFRDFQASPTSRTSHLLLSGDTLFAGSIGRTDLPGGDMATIMTSLRKLIALPDDTLVIPGHGPSSTIVQERRGNPFLQ